MRADENWNLILMTDPSGRRGIWMHAPLVVEAGVARREPFIELCAGREGDDVFLRLEIGHQVTAEDLVNLQDILSYAWGSHDIVFPRTP